MPSSQKAVSFSLEIASVGNAIERVVGGCLWRPPSAPSTHSFDFHRFLLQAIRDKIIRFFVCFLRPVTRSANTVLNEAKRKMFVKSTHLSLSANEGGRGVSRKDLFR